jgi:peptidoglycan/LPS O-acetylase OafA/YrhL
VESLLDEKPYRKLGQVPALDGVRGLAIISVLLFHAVGHHFPGGWIGVHIFFVLSGFLITTLLLQELQQRGHISLGAFYLRRIVRLAPALFVMILIFLVYILLTAHGANRHEQLHSVAVAATYRANLPGGGAEVGATQDLSFTWTLALEEQFYLLWPLLLILAAQRRLSPRRLMTLTAALAVGLAVWRAVLVAKGVSINHLYFRPDTTADSLLFGCLAGQAYVFQILPPKKVLRTAAPLAGLVMAAMVLRAPVTARWAYTVLPLLTVCTAGALLAIVEGYATTAQTLLSIPALRWIGRVSYSLYLWNTLVDETLRRDLHTRQAIVDSAILLTSFAFAAASYYSIERPLVGLRRRLHQEGLFRRTVAPGRPQALS